MQTVHQQHSDHVSKLADSVPTTCRQPTYHVPKTWRQHINKPCVNRQCVNQMQAVHQQHADHVSNFQTMCEQNSDHVSTTCMYQQLADHVSNRPTCRPCINIPCVNKPCVNNTQTMGQQIMCQRHADHV